MKHSTTAIRALPFLSKLLILSLLSACSSIPGLHSSSGILASPDGRLSLALHLDFSGAPRYSIALDGKPALQESKLGLVAETADFSKGMSLLSESNIEPVKDHYEILTAKRRLNDYNANRKIFHLQNATGRKLDIVFQLSNDGVAFRYEFPEASSEILKLKEETTSFHFFPGSKAWLQPMSVAKSGFQSSNPSYEEYYQKEIPVETPSTLGAGWVYPALFKSGDIWLLISESNLDRNYCGTRLRSESPDGEYSVGFPDPRESYEKGPVNPESKLPWKTPWRVIAIGDLKTIAESMLGVDLAAPPFAPADDSIQPGKSSWSWPLLGDRQTVFATQKRFVDYAADMGWHYCLVDALWDKQIGYDRLKELVDYGRGKGVHILVWYNSAGDWNTTPQTPRNMMVTHESRIKEFTRLKSIGVAGVKIDFFGGDGQSMIGYYHDILEDAGPFGLLMNFHGATLPRGWERTYPHLMTMEAIRGLEFATFEQANADQEPTHAATIPFTRNVFDPMDFTPMVLDKLPRTQRRTSSAFELALSVLFTSGIQHYAEIPEGMAKTPEFVRDCLKLIPRVWDDMKFVDGYPGKFAVIARQGGGHWYIAGINAEQSERKISIDLGAFSQSGKADLITDGDGGNLSFRREKIQYQSGTPVVVSLKPNGGFLMTAD